MPKLWKILAILLLPVIVHSTAFIDFSVISKIFNHEIEIYINECSSESSSSEQNEESNESSDDIDIANLDKHYYLLEKGFYYNSISTSKIANFPECYSPPPEKRVNNR